MWLSQEAIEILNMLKANKGQMFSVKEVSRRISRPKFEKDHLWARSILGLLFENGEVERDSSGFYYIPKEELSL